MNHLAMPAETTAPVASPHAAETRLHGVWLFVARSVWVVLAGLSVGLFITSVLVYYLGQHGLREGVYEHLISMTAVVNG